MAKRIFLSLFLCAFAFSFLFSFSVFALTDEQTQLKTRIDHLQGQLGKTRGQLYKEMKKPESTDSGDFICTYEKGLTAISLEPKKQGDKATSSDIVHVITVKVPSEMTKKDVREAIEGNGFDLGGKLFIQRESCQIMVSLEGDKCTQIQLIKM